MVFSPPTIEEAAMSRISKPTLFLLALAVAAALAGASVDASAHQMIYSLGTKTAVASA